MDYRRTRVQVRFVSHSVHFRASVNFQGAYPTCRTNHSLVAHFYVCGALFRGSDVFVVSMGIGASGSSRISRVILFCLNAIRGSGSRVVRVRYGTYPIILLCLFPRYFRLLHVTSTLGGGRSSSNNSQYAGVGRLLRGLLVPVVIRVRGVSEHVFLRGRLQRVKDARVVNFDVSNLRVREQYQWYSNVRGHVKLGVIGRPGRRPIRLLQFVLPFPAKIYQRSFLFNFRQAMNVMENALVGSINCRIRDG